MKVNILRAFVFGSVVLFVLAFVAPVASAQTEGFQIRPAIIEDKVSPGQSYKYSIKVTNISDSERTVNLLAQDITGVDDGGVPQFALEGEVTPFELSTWIILPKMAVTLRAGETMDVPFTVRVPVDASPGAHFGGVFFDARPDPQGETGSAVGTRVGTILNLRIDGDITEEMRLREFSTEKFLYDAPPVKFTSKVDNLGNVLVRPHGLIEITDMFGKKVGQVEVNASAAAVFPGGNREYEATWEHEGLAFGRYQALLSFVYGEEGRKTVVRTTSFWILPLKPTLIALGSLFALILILYMIIKMHIRRKLNEMGLSAKADNALYARRYERPVSRMTFVVVFVLVFVVLFLLMIFYMFA